MTVDYSTIYKLRGTKGPEQDRVKDALDWLLSPAAQGIGEKLLRDAYVLHRKPIQIMASPEDGIAFGEAACVFVKLNNKPILYMNPQHVKALSVRSSDGSPHPMSIERLLAHELTHAGQKTFEEEMLKKYELRSEAENAYLSRFSPEQLVEMSQYLPQAIMAPDYDSAKASIEAHVDNFVLPTEDGIKAMLFADPRYLEHIDKIEVPAMEMENKIAALRGEPTRTDYTTDADISPEHMRKTLIDELCDLHAASKPHLSSSATEKAESPERKDGKLWGSAVLNKRGSRTLDR